MFTSSPNPSGRSFQIYVKLDSDSQIRNIQWPWRSLSKYKIWSGYGFSSLIDFALVDRIPSRFQLCPEIDIYVILLNSRPQGSKSASSLILQNSAALPTNFIQITARVSCGYKTTRLGYCARTESCMSDDYANFFREDRELFDNSCNTLPILTSLITTCRSKHPFDESCRARASQGGFVFFRRTLSFHLVEELF